MKKIYQTFILFFSILFMVSCANMDIDPMSITSEDNITTNESGINAYLVTLYNGLPIEDMSYSNAGFVTFSGIPFLFHLSGEAIPHNLDYSKANYSGSQFAAWKYTEVRNTNKFISLLNKNQNFFTKEQATTWMGEAYMIRAYLYFGLVKRYGGIPLITEVQTYTGNNLEELQVPRNTEKEVYDYIASQLDSAVMYLPATNQMGQFTKWAAYTLKSRAMLYAGSIAQFGSMDNSCPYIGIPSSEANRYYQLARDAAGEVINNGGFSLYNANQNKTNNYTDLFLHATNNPEVIFIKDFKYPDKIHNFDVFGVPYAYRSSGGYGSNFCPTLDFVESYEMIDGTQASLPIEDESGNPVEYENPLDLFENRDPRLAATVIFPYALWRGDVVEVRRGVIEDGVLYEATMFGTKTPKGVSISGNCGFSDSEATSTGFYLRKYMDYNRAKDNLWSNRCDQDWIDMRLAEVYLNYAEACVETNTDMDKALIYINKIRERAGIAPSTGLDREKVRHERSIELSFENHRYWDVKRWRIAVDLFNNRKFYTLQPYYNLDNNKHFFKKRLYDPSGIPGKTFQSRYYYLQIPTGEIQKNPNLVQNPGY